VLDSWTEIISKTTKSRNRLCYIVTGGRPVDRIDFDAVCYFAGSGDAKRQKDRLDQRVSASKKIPFRSENGRNAINANSCSRSPRLHCAIHTPSSAAEDIFCMA